MRLTSMRLALGAVATLTALSCTPRLDLGGNDSFVGDAGSDATSMTDAGTGDDANTEAGEAGTAACIPAQRWPVMNTEIFSPPRFFAGIDLARSDRWEGLTLEQGEEKNCKSVLVGPGDSAWGFNKEVEVFYDTETHAIYQLQLKPGYTGAISFHDRSNANQYVMRMGAVPTKNGQPFEIPWSQLAARDAVATELFNAMMITFGPAIGNPFPNDSANCKADRSCLLSSDGGDGSTYFGARPLGIYFNTPANVPQPMNSTLSLVYVFTDKRVGVSQALPTLKIDAVGPTLTSDPMFGGVAGCSPRIGMRWSELLTSCVLTSTNSIANDIAYNKLIGGRGHDLERWSFTSWGDRPEVYRAPTGAPILATDVPAPGDIVLGWQLERGSLGSTQTLNDLDAQKVGDAHGVGLVMREWARLVQNDLHARVTGATPHALGATECIGAAPAAGCTGLEEIAFPGLTYAEDTAQIRALVAGGKVSAGLLYRLAATFCDDPGTFAVCPDDGQLPQITRDRVVKVLGHGNASSLPSELRDARYYFRFYVVALLKYMKAAGVSATPAPSDVAAATIALESLTFGQSGVSPFDTFRYVERAFMGTTSVPLVISHAADIATAGTRSLGWTTRLESGETALYRALAVDKQAPAGSVDDVSLTDLFGSPVLALAYASLHCATAIDPGGCATSSPPPQDSAGQLTLDLDAKQPVLARYPGTFGRSPFAKGTSAVTIVSTDAANALARIKIPNEPDPYHGPTTPTATLDATVGWIDATHAERLTLATSPTLDTAVARAQLRFLGNALGFTIHYRDGTSGTIVVDAIAASDFAGEVFLCKDPTSGDLLRARSYSSAAVILDWIAAHPAATTACGLVTRMNGAGVTLVASTKNGVELTMSTGDGAGRVVRAVLYDPTLVP